MDGEGRVGCERCEMGGEGRGGAWCAVIGVFAWDMLWDPDRGTWSSEIAFLQSYKSEEGRLGRWVRRERHVGG